MIPILFESTETSFTTNGIGRLSDAISCIVTEERNGPYELEMQYPITGQYFSELQHSRIIYAVPADGKAAQPFRIYRIEKPLNGVCTIYAEHVSYELAHIPVKPFTASTCVTALQGLVTNAGQTCPFSVWTNKSVTANFTLREPKTFRELLGGVQGSILDIYGKGEYEFDGYTVKLYVNRGTDSGVVIRYAKNLTELVNDENIEEVYTGVCPYWASENGTVVMLPEVAIWAPTAANFPYKRTKIVDFSDEFEEQPTVAQLRAKTNQFIADNDIGIPAGWRVTPSWTLQDVSREIPSIWMTLISRSASTTTRFLNVSTSATPSPFNMTLWEYLTRPKSSRRCLMCFGIATNPLRLANRKPRLPPSSRTLTAISAGLRPKSPGMTSLSGLWTM